MSSQGASSVIGPGGGGKVEGACSNGATTDSQGANSNTEVDYVYAQPTTCEDGNGCQPVMSRKACWIMASVSACSALYDDSPAMTNNNASDTSTPAAVDEGEQADVTCPPNALIKHPRLPGNADHKRMEEMATLHQDKCVEVV